jgi:5'-3' exonuclease
MGIPSYYKKLIDTLPGLVRKTHPDTQIDWLWMDFNCLIYHCLRKMPPYSDKDTWEAELIETVVQYCEKVVALVAPKCGVYIAIDGVVPMAKMRQQRLRRFKSSWATRNAVGDDCAPAWNTNAITPGTAFMGALKKRLSTMCKAHKKWILSSSDEPGEGEHKIMEQWRSGKYKGNFAVYGLDADLIVLSILNSELGRTAINSVWLFREEIEDGSIKHDEDGEEEFQWFSINTLKEYLRGGHSEEFLINYCFAMSVLGNDFLPSSLSLKIRDDGHAKMIHILQKLTRPLVNSDLSINEAAIKSLFEELAQIEEERIHSYVSKKLMMSRNLGQRPDTSLMALGENNWPLGHVEEAVLMHYKQLHRGWRSIYSELAHGSKNINNINNACKEYLFGLQWIWAYYIGQMDKVCYNWNYPYSLPPLWENIRDYMNGSSLPDFPGTIDIRATDIKPVEQLCIVLPLESWDLIPAGNVERSLPEIAPYLFPHKFGFGSLGKRYFWECEAEIPVPTIREIKALLKIYA